MVTLDAVEGVTSLADLLATTATPPELTAAAGDTAVLPYSSGTTGRAKGVILTHRNLVANLCQFAPMGHVGSEHEDPRRAAVLPHLRDDASMMNQGLHKRATVVTMPKFDLAEFLRIISEYAVERVYIAPPMAVALAKHPMVDDVRPVLRRRDLLRRRAAGRRAGPRHGQAAGLPVLQGYGMTELSPVSHCMPDDRPDMDLDSSGFALPNIECKLVDPETGEEVGPGRARRAVGAGPERDGRLPEQPRGHRATLDADGWLHTGDIATVDADGVFTIVDRLKELIKYKGYQVPPAELEAVLLTHDRIADAAVIGVRDDEGEEVPKAFVVPRPGAELTAEEVMAFVAERVAPYKKVRAVEFIDAIPKSAAGKILRKDLRAREAAATPSPGAARTGL